MKKRALRHLGRAALGLITIAATWTVAAESLPRPEPAFQGRINPNDKDSTPAWPAPIKAPAGAPNVVLILLDDVGFSASSTFGGAAATPALDALAAEGLRYNRFHTAAICSPTRASLLTGRNHHQVGFGTVTNSSTGYPGYNGIWPRSTASIAEMLRQNGYNTAAFGKWHNTPDWEISIAGPFDRWPTGLGFEYFYGYHGGATNQWRPQLYRNTLPVETPATPEQGYHLTTDLANDAITWLQRHDAVAPAKPYFLYFATGATHEPHHAPKAWIDQYRGKFDQGWDKLREENFIRQKRLGVIPADARLTPRAEGLPAWDSLSADQKKLYARQMEVYAGFLAHTDHEVGRVLEAVRRGPRADNTMIIYIVGDNGSSGEGGLDGTENWVATLNGLAVLHMPELRDNVPTMLKHIDELGGPNWDNHYAAAWAWADSTPFQYVKQVASHLGGTRNPMIIAWPGHIRDRGGIRSQFSHVNDIVPTILEAAHVAFPDSVNGVAQIPLEGNSLEYSFDHPNAPSTHRTQYFEVVGNRAIYQDGWMASATHFIPWLLKPPTSDTTQDRWELYNLNDDYSQANNLAERYPGKLKELQQLFDREARRNQVYPLTPNPASNGQRPSLTDGRQLFTYHAGMSRLTGAETPDLSLVPAYRITAHAQIPAEGAQGVIVADGWRTGGFTLYIKDGHLVYENNWMGHQRDVLVSAIPVPSGTVELAFDYTSEGKRPAGGGTGRLLINGKPVGEKHFDHVGPFHQSIIHETFDVGEEFGETVTEAYTAPFRFTGTLERVVVELR